MIKLAPSILSADFSKLGEDVAEVEKGGAHLIHVDVMDGHFVPNISYGATVMKSLLGKTKMPFDVHLMIEEPQKYIDDFMTENTEYITVHQETCPGIREIIKRIKKAGAKVGVSINPETSEDTVMDVLDSVDMVLIMSVHPGFGGQVFIESALKKAEVLAEVKKKNGLSFKIEMDGGINLLNIKKVIESGTEIIVAGSSIFKTENIEETTKRFLDIMNNEEQR